MRRWIVGLLCRAFPELCPRSELDGLRREYWQDSARMLDIVRGAELQGYERIKALRRIGRDDVAGLPADGIWTHPAQRALKDIVRRDIARRALSGLWCEEAGVPFGFSCAEELLEAKRKQVAGIAGKWRERAKGAS